MKSSRTGAFLLLLLAVVLDAAAARRIRFQRGVTSAEITGHFTRKARENVFVVRVSKGQRMKVEIKPLGRNLVTSGIVDSPSGKSDGAPGGVIFNSELTETGDYKIRVFERYDNLPGRFTLRVEIK
jgi:hypothetical protein